MEVHWYPKVIVALTVALMSLVFRVLTAGQGYFTAKIWGLDFGFARLKSWTFFVWFGELFRFPFDAVVFFIGLVAVVTALYLTVRHLVSQRRVDA